jgi:predicted enzyme related to lactoylglutathione lyase
MPSGITGTRQNACSAVASPKTEDMAYNADTQTRRDDMSTNPSGGSYLEHAAFKVRDMDWHIRFFSEVFGWKVRKVDGDAVAPRQVWLGGAQLMADPGFDGTEGRVNHIGIRCADMEAAITAALAHEGVSHLEKGRHWLVLPEGFIVELLPASPRAVATALMVHPEL